MKTKMKFEVDQMHPKVEDREDMATIPYIVFEYSEHLHEKAERRYKTAVILSLTAFLATNAIWLLYAVFGVL